MYEKGFAYLLQAEHEKVIYGVLKHLHVSRQDPDYEDLVVEGQLVFAQAFCMYCESHAIVKEAEVMPYLYQKIKWRLLDVLRKRHVSNKDNAVYQPPKKCCGQKRKVILMISPRGIYWQDYGKNVH